MYFAVITLTVTLILHQVMGTTADPRYAVGQARLGGYNGMTDIPSLALEVPGRAPLTLDPVPLFYVVGGLLLRSEEHTSELQSRFDLVCRLLLEKKKT